MKKQLDDYPAESARFWVKVIKVVAAIVVIGNILARIRW